VQLTREAMSQGEQSSTCRASFFGFASGLDSIAGLYSGPGGESNAVALQRDPARAHATPLSRRRLAVVSAMARSVCAASR
jgi:hypothetical protein